MNAFWNSLWRGWIVALAISFGSYGAHADAAEEGLLIVDGAQNLFRIPRTDASRQISYTMDMEYPARAIGEPQWEQLRKLGWIKCRHMDAEMEAANQDWVSFADISETPARTIHQHLTHWSRGDQMIMIGLRYYSETRSGHAKSMPDNREQHIDLIFDDEHGPDMAEWLQLDCAR